MINETPCRHCTKRKINCHASCEEYLGWRKKADELRDKCGKARLQDAGFVNAKIKNIYKWQKHLRKKKPPRRAAQSIFLSPFMLSVCPVFIQAKRGMWRADF